MPGEIAKQHAETSITPGPASAVDPDHDRHWLSALRDEKIELERPVGSRRIDELRVDDVAGSGGPVPGATAERQDGADQEEPASALAGKDPPRPPPHFRKR